MSTMYKNYIYCNRFIKCNIIIHYAMYHHLISIIEYLYDIILKNSVFIRDIINLNIFDFIDFNKLTDL